MGEGHTGTLWLHQGHQAVFSLADPQLLCPQPTKSSWILAPLMVHCLSVWRAQQEMCVYMCSCDLPTSARPSVCTHFVSVWPALFPALQLHLSHFHASLCSLLAAGFSGQCKTLYILEVWQQPNTSHASSWKQWQDSWETVPLTTCPGAYLGMPVVWLCNLETLLLSAGPQKLLAPIPRSTRHQ